MSQVWYRPSQLLRVFLPQLTREHGPMIDLYASWSLIRLPTLWCFLRETALWHSTYCEFEWNMIPTRFRFPTETTTWMQLKFGSSVEHMDHQTFHDTRRSIRRILILPGQPMKYLGQLLTHYLSESITPYDQFLMMDHQGRVMVNWTHGEPHQVDTYVDQVVQRLESLVDPSVNVTSILQTIGKTLHTMTDEEDTSYSNIVEYHIVWLNCPLTQSAMTDVASEWTDFMEWVSHCEDTNVTFVTDAPITEEQHHWFQTHLQRCSVYSLHDIHQFNDIKGDLHRDVYWVTRSIHITYSDTIDQVLTHMNYTQPDDHTIIIPYYYTYRNQRLWISSKSNMGPASLHASWTSRRGSVHEQQYVFGPSVEDHTVNPPLHVQTCDSSRLCRSTAREMQIGLIMMRVYHFLQQWQSHYKEPETGQSQDSSVEEEESSLPRHCRLPCISSDPFYRSLCNTLDILKSIRDAWFWAQHLSVFQQWIQQWYARRRRSFHNQVIETLQEQGVTLPEWGKCPITHELMFDPVVASDGFTYEREAITAWLQQKTISPLTRAAITHTLYPNRVVYQQLQEYVQNQGLFVIPCKKSL